MPTNTEPVAATVRNFAARLGVSESHVWALLREGKLNAIRLKRRTLIPLSELDRILASASANAA